MMTAPVLPRCSKLPSRWRKSNPATWFALHGGALKNPALSVPRLYVNNLSQAENDQDHALPEL